MSRKGLRQEAPPGQKVAAVASGASRVRPPFRMSLRMVIDLIAAIDIALVILAAAIAKGLYIALYLESSESIVPHLVAGTIGAGVVNYAMRMRGLYDPIAISNWRLRLRDVGIAVSLSFLALIAVAYLIKQSADFSRGWALTWFALSITFLYVNRYAAAALLNWLAAIGSTERRVAIVADDESGHALAANVQAVPGTTVVGVFQLAQIAGQPTAATVDDLIAVGQRNEIDEIIVCVPGGTGRSVAQLVDQLRILPADVWLHAPNIDLPVHSVTRLGNAGLLQVKPRPMKGWRYLSKLLVDYVAGTVALVVLTPLMIAIAAAIKLESRGPVFFWQRRHGLNHRVIHVCKFRTMSVLEDGEQIEQARQQDPRVTRVGRFLRRTSLDELPQLFNVLKAEMSLVGPRPHALAHNREYSQFLENYANRHAVKPGITGWAQVNGFRGSTDDPERMRARVQMDLHYIDNWSLLLDAKILVLTLFIGFMHRNAY